MREIIKEVDKFLIETRGSFTKFRDEIMQKMNAQEFNTANQRAYIEYLEHTFNIGGHNTQWKQMNNQKAIDHISDFCLKTIEHKGHVPGEYSPDSQSAYKLGKIHVAEIILSCIDGIESRTKHMKEMSEAK